MLVLKTQSKNSGVHDNSFKSVDDLKEKYLSKNPQLFLPKDDDIVLSFVRYKDGMMETIVTGSLITVTFKELLHMLGIIPSTVIPLEKVSNIVDAYRSNIDSLYELKTQYENNELEPGFEISESFEQGYNNALEYVFKEFEIETQRDVPERLYCLRIDIDVDNEDTLAKEYFDFISIEDAKSAIITAIKDLCERNQLPNGTYDIRCEVSSYPYGKPNLTHEVYEDGDEFTVSYENGALEIMY